MKFMLSVLEVFEVPSGVKEKSLGDEEVYIFIKSCELNSLRGDSPLQEHARLHLGRMRHF